MEMLYADITKTKREKQILAEQASSSARKLGNVCICYFLNGVLLS